MVSQGGMALDVVDLTVRYSSGVLALRGISVQVAAAGCTAVVGESGSGKSTLAGAVTGLLPAGTQIHGSIRVAGTELTTLSPRARRRAAGTLVGFVDQDPMRSANPQRRVGGHVAEAWRAHGQRPDTAAVHRVMATLGLPDVSRLRGRPHTWSGGMMQRANVAAATIRGPVLVVADEPTSALDAELAADALLTLRSHANALLLITHDLHVVAAHADQMVVLYAGAVVEAGPAARVLNDPRHPYTIALRAAQSRPGAGLPQPIAGTAPRLMTEPTGCAFRDRCAHAAAVCATTAPVLADGVACHHVNSMG